jgi:hypothetical protein
VVMTEVVVDIVVEVVFVVVAVAVVVVDPEVPEQALTRFLMRTSSSEMMDR